MKRILYMVLALVISTISIQASMPTTSAISGSEWIAGRIIDDSYFTDKNSMSIGDIQSFLNQKVGTSSYGTPGVCDTNGTRTSEYGGGTRAQYGASRGYPAPYTCLKDYFEVPKTEPSSGIPANNYGGKAIPPGAKSAANIIYDAAQAYNISPKVLLVTIQKESSGPLITDDWPFEKQYTYAMGAHCPDTAACDVNYSGFSMQIRESARLFRYYLDNMTKSWWPYKKLGDNTVLYNPSSSCGSSVVNIQSYATAALYTYTPYQPNQAALNNMYGTGNSCSAYGNRNFWRMYNDWFGRTVGPPDYSCKGSVNVPSVPTGGKVVANRYSASGYATYTLTLPNNTGSGCMEVHTWTANQQSWLSNIATNHPSINPADGEIISGNIYGDPKSELIFVKYTNTGSGRIEVHTWDSSNQRWLSNIATNHPSVNMTDARVIAADTNGDGLDELVFVKYRNTGSGRIEVHTWAPGQQNWLSNVATGVTVGDPMDARVIAANLYGDRADEFVFVKYRNTGSGRIEVHTWAPGQQNWLSNVATNHPVVDPNDIEVISSSINTNSADNLILVKYRNTGSGRIEVHTWAPGQQNWLSNVATSYGTL